MTVRSIDIVINLCTVHVKHVLYCIEKLAFGLVAMTSNKKGVLFGFTIINQ